MVFDLGSKKCFFEEMTQEQIERQISTNLYGPMSVTRAVLPIMRKARSSNRICNTSF
ncbi:MULTISPECIES: SDR family NAD(P)-dependent oxidoreductase [unclassified Paenibacillus]|uniref:SDR family NAD(P)-dependent oxidoreductase n=1 Tax=unclassified Paenibacillus TaxID=185978 RepID=UPI00363C6246